MHGHRVLTIVHMVLRFWKSLGSVWWGRSQELREINSLALLWPGKYPSHTLPVGRAVRALM